MKNQSIILRNQLLLYIILSFTISVSLVILNYGQAFAFNSILLMDPDFMEFAVIRVPLIASILMGTIESAITYKWLKPKETPFIYYLYQYFFSCFVAILLSIIIMSILFFMVGEILTETDENAVVNLGVFYFMAVFLYIGWDQRRKEIEKMWGDEKKYVPIKNIVFLTTCISYSLLYSYYYFVII